MRPSSVFSSSGNPMGALADFGDESASVDLALAIDGIGADGGNVRVAGDKGAVVVAGAHWAGRGALWEFTR